MFINFDNAEISENDNEIIINLYPSNEDNN